MSTSDSSAPCELILKVGANEWEQISTVVTNLLRACSMPEENFVSVEHQIQPTTYFGTFTSQSSLARVPVPCQALSCVLFPIDSASKAKSRCFDSLDFWRFHHKIELFNEQQHVIGRQDYYELSDQLPLWSVCHIPKNRRRCVRLNIFTGQFESMSTFYTRLFQRSPSSRKPGFVLFSFPSKNQLHYQLSIKSSPSMHSYSISHGAQLKFRLSHFTHLLREYSRKLFTLNPSECYIYDPDGNLLHLHLSPSSASETRNSGRWSSISSLNEGKKPFSDLSYDVDSPSSTYGYLQAYLQKKLTPRINIGITLDSRLRKTPVLQMLRSSTMESLSIARF